MKHPILPAVLSLASVAALVACDGQKPSPPPAPPASQAAEHLHGHGDKVVELGTTDTASFKIKAARDDEEFKAGGEAPSDFWVDPKVVGAKVATVRFWVGTEDAKGAVKMKGEIEIPEQPNHYHAHAPIPDPIPADAKLWVEVTGADGKTESASFDLKR